MTDDRWTRADEILTAALDAPSAERPALVHRLCGDDDALRVRVERLLASAEAAEWPSPTDLLLPTEDGGPPPTPALAAGQRLAAYEITGELGSGGMGVVYRARDPRIGRDVAIKLLPPSFLDDDARASRFLLEARLVSKLNHPNVLTIYEVDRCEQGLYIVSELVDGPTLRTLARYRRVSAEEAKDIMRQAATGLGKAHAADVVHRDVKPDNIMVTPDGIVKILDFGIAKTLAADASMAASLTRTGVVAGTPGYIAPEQLRDEPVDARTDVFALGVVIWELLASRHPFHGKTLAQIIDATLHHRPASLTELRSDVPPAFAALVDLCLAKDPEDRPHDGNALVVELHELGSALPGSLASGGRRGIVARVAERVSDLFSSRRQGAVATPPPTPVGELVVAVLPVHDRSGDAELGMVGAGRVLSDVFLHLLADGGHLHLVSPLLLSEAAARAGRPLEDAAGDPPFARSIAEEAGANAVLTASLDKEAPTGLLVLGGTVTELATGRVRRSYRAVAPDWERLIRELAQSVQVPLQTPTTKPVDTDTLVEQLPSRSLEAYTEFVRGRDLADVGQYADALAPLRRAVDLDPKLAVAWSEMGCAYYFTGDEARSRAAHWKAIEHIDHASRKERLWIEASTTWVSTQNADLFRRRLQAFMDAYPDDRDGYLYMGYSYAVMQKNPAPAIEWLEKALHLTPSFFPAARLLAQCWQDLGDAPRAREALQAYLAQPFLPDHGREAARELLERLA